VERTLVTVGIHHVSNNFLRFIKCFPQFETASPNTRPQSKQTIHARSASHHVIFPHVGNLDAPSMFETEVGEGSDLYQLRCPMACMLKGSIQSHARADSPTSRAIIATSAASGAARGTETFAPRRARDIFCPRRSPRPRAAIESSSPGNWFVPGRPCLMLRVVVGDIRQGSQRVSAPGRRGHQWPLRGHTRLLLIVTSITSGGRPLVAAANPNTVIAGEFMTAWSVQMSDVDHRADSPNGFLSSLLVHDRPMIAVLQFSQKIWQPSWLSTSERMIDIPYRIHFLGKRLFGITVPGRRYAHKLRPKSLHYGSLVWLVLAQFSNL
jgi:hypothetical protein